MPRASNPKAITKKIFFMMIPDARLKVVLPYTSSVQHESLIKIQKRPKTCKNVLIQFLQSTGVIKSKLDFFNVGLKIDLQEHKAVRFRINGNAIITNREIALVIVLQIKKARPLGSFNATDITGRRKPLCFFQKKVSG